MQKSRIFIYSPHVTFENVVSAHDFVTIIKRKVRIGDQATNGATNGATNEETNEETNEVSRSKPRLTKEEKDIVNFCSIPRTAQEILDRIGVTNQTFNRKKYILPLLDKKVLEMTIPENPNDRNQKYRKVRKV